MQKIILQDLSGRKASAERKAKYTWRRNEKAWYFCPIFRNIYQIKFTGKRWLSGNKWNRIKIYEFEYIQSLDPKLKIEGCEEKDKFSHQEENVFFTTKNEAIRLGMRYITQIKDNAMLTFEKDMDKLRSFKEKKENDK